MGKIRQLAGETAIYGVSTVVARLINFLLVPIYTHYIFATNEYGIVTELYAYVTFLLIIFSYGLETAFFRYGNKTGNFQKVMSTSFFSLAISSSIFTGIILLLSTNIADLLHYPDHSEYFVWIGLILFFDTIVAIPFANLRQEKKAVLFASIKLLNVGINILANLFFLILCPYLAEHYTNIYSYISFLHNPEIGVGYVFISNLIASTLTIFFLIPEFKKITFEIDQDLWKQMMRYSLPVMLIGLAGMVNLSLDKVMLKHLLPYSMEINLTHVGIYGACYKLAIFLTIANQAFRFAAEPFFFSESVDKNAPKTYSRVMNYYVFTACCIFLMVSLYIDIFKHIIGPDYHEGLHVVPILLMANVFLGMFYNLSIWYKITGKTMYGAVISFGGALITIALNIILIPLYGYTGSAWAALFCFFSMALASWITGRKQYPVPYEVFKILFYLILAIVMFLFADWFKNNIAGEWAWAAFLVNTVLLLAFVMIFILKEKLKFVSRKVH